MYDNHSHITTIAEVEDFAKFLYVQKKLAFHPDDDFADYISSESNEPFLSNEEVELFNRLMNECFNVCDSVNEDIYDVMGKLHPLLAEK